MQLECEYCYESTFIPLHRIGHSPLFCFFCGSKLPIKSPRRDPVPILPREKTAIHTPSFTRRPKLTIDYKPNLIREPLLLRKPEFCQYQKLCREYVWSLNWPREYFNRRYDRCYCLQCHPASGRDTYQTAGETYVIPRGWARFGLSVDSVKADRENLWKTWIVTYHGTKISAAR
jgi:hypothetical protein